MWWWDMRVAYHWPNGAICSYFPFILHSSDGLHLTLVGVALRHEPSLQSYFFSVIYGEKIMNAIRFFFLLFVFIGIVASCAVVVLLGALMLRFLPILILVILSCLVFWWLLKKAGTASPPS
jgi:hypothetical protein